MQKLCQFGNNKVYIQSALNVDSPEKKAQETFSLRNTGDFFKKIIVLDGNSRLWTDEDGVTFIGVIPFLLEDILSAKMQLNHIKTDSYILSAIIKHYLLTQFLLETPHSYFSIVLLW